MTKTSRNIYNAYRETIMMMEGLSPEIFQQNILLGKYNENLEFLEEQWNQDRFESTLNATKDILYNGPKEYIINIKRLLEA